MLEDKNIKKLRVSAAQMERVFWEEISRKQLGVKLYQRYGMEGYLLGFYCPHTQRERMIKLNNDVQSDFWRGMNVVLWRLQNGDVAEALEEVLCKIEEYCFTAPKLVRVREKV